MFGWKPEWRCLFGCVTKFHPMCDELPDADTLEESVARAAEPYATLDPASLPSWWQSAIDEFEAAGLHPYQPARFEDGEIVQVVCDRLEERYGVVVDLFGQNVHPGDEWQVRVDGRPVSTVGHRRTVTGGSVFEMKATAFVRAVEREVTD